MCAWRTVYGSVIVLLFPSETEPFRASARPVRFALSTSVILVRAMTFPCHCELVPSVADDPTTQYTLWALAPLISTTFPAVIKVLFAWNTNVADVSFPASNVTVQVTPMHDEEPETPAAFVVHPRAVVMNFAPGHGSPIRES